MEGDRIADLRSPAGSLLSVYAGRPSPGGFAALLSALVKPVRERSADMDRTVAKSVRLDAGRIHELADQLEVDSAPGYVIFASNLDGIFVLEPLDQPAPNVAMIGPRPYLRPLRAIPRGLRSGIVIADNTTARTFIAVDGLVEELETPIVGDVGNRGFGGFSGYDEHTVRSRADEVSSRVWREAGERLMERHLERPFDYLAIGSQDETVEEIARLLHPYLAHLQRETFVANPKTMALPWLRAEIADMDKQVRRHRQEALAGRICDTAWSGGNAVLGLLDVIASVNTQAVDTLVVAGPFTRPGVICDSCGFLARDGAECPVCGAALFEVDDVIGAVMDSVVAAGGRVHQIAVASPLDREGVGALTRFPVGVPAHSLG